MTTEINGNCGMGGVPLPPAVADLTRAANATIDPDPAVRWDWTDLAGYAAALERHGLAINTAPLLGHLPLRIAVAGEAARPLDDAERPRSSPAIDACLDDGAIGVSTGLMYPPAMSADRDELVAIGRAVARHDRSSRSTCATTATTCSTRSTEALDIARASGCRLQVSHLAVAGRRNWGAVPRALELIDARARRRRRCRRRHLSVHRGQRQPVPAPARLGAGRRPGRDRRAARRNAEERRAIREDWRDSLFFGWDEIEVSSSEPGLEETLGLTVQAVADAWSMDPNETALDSIARSDNRVQMVAYGRSEDDLRAVLTHDLTSIGSDGLAMDPDGPSSAGRPHPRSFGCYPRSPRAVRRARPGCSRWSARSRCPPRSRPTGPGLTDRGRLVEGAVADIVVFDADTIVDQATFQDPLQAPTGIHEVIVAGRRVIADGRQIDAVRPGRVLLA